jgi:hypothetical protein
MYKHFVSLQYYGKLNGTIKYRVIEYREFYYTYYSLQLTLIINLYFYKKTTDNTYRTNK